MLFEEMANRLKEVETWTVILSFPSYHHSAEILYLGNPQGGIPEKSGLGEAWVSLGTHLWSNPQMGINMTFSGFNIFHELLQRQILLFPTYQDYSCTYLTM
jgi:hypothetical protein